MAPRKPVAQLRPARPHIRRSARIQAAANQATSAGDKDRVNKAKHTPKPKPQKYDCTTCDRTMASSAFPENLPTDNCEHMINTCKSCLNMWITTMLEKTTYDKLSCPECPEIMQNEDVKMHAAKTVYTRFDELEKRAMAEKIPGWRWCLAPDCKAGQVHQPLIEQDAAKSTSRKSKKGKQKKEDVDDMFICNECGAKACVYCDRP